MLKHVGERRILVVEDEPIVADTLRQILSARGYETNVAYSAEQALDNLDDWDPELAILDVMLPKMNGIELAMSLKVRLPVCHTLLISGQPSVESLLQAAREQGHDFEILAKPVHPLEILRRIGRMFSGGNREPGTESGQAWAQE